MITSRFGVLVVLAAGAAMATAGFAVVRDDAVDPSDAGRPPTDPVSTDGTAVSRLS